MSLSRRVLWRIAGVVTPYHRFRYYDAELLRRPYDAHAIEAVRTRKVQALVRHAYDHVPYYRDLFDRHRIAPDDVRRPEDLDAIPVLTKELLRNNFDRLFADNIPRRDVVVTSTGGSTGSPAHFSQDKRYVELNQAALMRSLSWSGWKPGDLTAWVVGLDDTQGIAARLSLAGRRILNGKLFLNAFDVSESSLSAWCRLIRRHRPESYYGYASALTMLAKYVLEKQITLPPAVAAFNVAEKLYREQIPVIEDGLKCPVRDFYGCREIFNIAATCGEGRMHQIADMVHLSPDEAGNVIATPLDNFAMPLLRYMNGDVVETSRAVCDCGLQLPVLEMKVGRTTDIFVNERGKQIHGEYFTHLMYGIHGIGQFQFHQKSLTEMILRVVLDGNRPRDEVERSLEHVKREVRENCDLPLSCEVVAEIPKTRVGKHIFTISEVSRG